MTDESLIILYKWMREMLSNKTKLASAAILILLMQYPLLAGVNDIFDEYLLNTNRMQLRTLGSDEQLSSICSSLSSGHPIKKTFCDPTNKPVLPNSLQMMVKRLGVLPVGDYRKTQHVDHTALARPEVTWFLSPQNEGSNVSMRFVRGEQYAEIVVDNKQDQHNKIYLVSFRQPCNDSSIGCTANDLLTQAVEDNWISVTLFQAENINTAQ